MGLTRIKMHVFRGPEDNGHFYWSEKRVRISLLFLTLETLDFKSEHFFESHGQLNILLILATAKKNDATSLLGNRKKNGSFRIQPPQGE